MSLGRLGVLSIFVMLAQVLLGVAVNLWVVVAPKRPWSNISHEGLLVVHVAVGVALLLLAFLVLVKAFEEASRRDKLSAVTAFAGVLGAFFCGIAFVASGGESDLSFGMALGWVVALAADLFLVLRSGELTQVGSHHGE